MVIWQTLTHGEDLADYCILPAVHWVDWGIYQPTKQVIFDYSGANQHSASETGRNAAFGEETFAGSESGNEEIFFTETQVFNVEDFGVERVPADIGCNFRTTVRNAGVHSQTLTLTDSNSNTLWSTVDGSCSADSIYLDSGESYTLHFTSTSNDVNSSVSMIMDYSITVFQPLLLGDDGTAILRSETSMEPSELTSMMVDNPTYHKNPKSLDAKLIYSLFIPCLGVGAMVFLLMRSMARGYEWEMNKCYGCDLCDDACPVRLFNAGDKLNIIYNSWNNEDDGVPTLFMSHLYCLY